MRVMGLLLLLLGMLVSAAGAATYYVDGKTASEGDGSSRKPFKTISYALKHISLQPGDTLGVRRGTYREAVTIDGLSGTVNAPITVKAIDGPRTATIFYHNPKNIRFRTWPDAPAVINLLHSSHVVIDGFVASGGATRDEATTVAGVRIEGRSSFCTVQNSELMHCYLGWRVWDSDDNQCINTLLHDNGFCPFVQGSKPLEIISGYGAYICIGTKRNVMDGCEIYNNCGYGVQVKGYDHIIRNCKFHDNGQGTRDPHGQPWYVNSNSGPGGGLMLNAGERCLVYNNLIYNNPSWGVCAYGFIGASVYNNTIYDNNLLGTHGYGVVNGNSDGRVTHAVRNNILLKNIGGALAASVPANLVAFATEDHNYVDDATYQGTGGTHVGTFQTSTSPFLSTDPRSKDFLRLNPNANPSAVDKGTDLSAFFTVDIEGTHRPEGLAWDLGAFESRALQRKED